MLETVLASQGSRLCPATEVSLDAAQGGVAFVLGVASIQSRARQAAGSRLARNAAWIFLGQGMSVVCQAVYFIVLAWMLGALQYGIYAGAFSLVMLLVQYRTLGSSQVFLRYVCPEHNRYARYWGYTLLTILLVGSVATILVIAGGPLVAHSYSRPMLAWLAIANCLCLRFTCAAAYAFQAFERMRATALLNLMTNFLRMTAAVVMFLTLHRATAEQFALAALAVSVIGMAIAVAVTNRQFGQPEYDWKLTYQRTGEGLIFAFTFSTGGILNDIDKVMLGHYGMNAANGVYSMAYKAIDVCMMPITAIHSLK